MSVPINIRDDRGIMFYTSEPVGPVSSFNLPAGRYWVDTGYFKPLSEPLKFKKEKLPMPEIAFAELPLNFKIVFAPNKNKCTIFWKKKLIVFDDGTATGVDFREVPRPQFEFIKNHEYGHTFYGYGNLYSHDEAEAYCDLFASNRMLDAGYNPSQIKAAPRQTLSEKQEYRKNFIEETMLTNTQYPL